MGAGPAGFRELLVPGHGREKADVHPAPRQAEPPRATTQDRCSCHELAGGLLRPEMTLPNSAAFWMLSEPGAPRRAAFLGPPVFLCLDCKRRGAGGLDQAGT